MKSQLFIFVLFTICHFKKKIINNNLKYEFVLEHGNLIRWVHDASIFYILKSIFNFFWIV